MLILLNLTFHFTLQVLLSGGVDSTVCTALLNRALNQDQVIAVHIDNGFMRKRESQSVTTEHGVIWENRVSRGNIRRKMEVFVFSALCITRICSFILIAENPPTVN